MLKYEEYSLKLRIGNKGFVGSISLSVQLTHGNNTEIVFAEIVDQEWRNAIRFAVEYFYESFFVQTNQRLVVEVIDLSTLVVDTHQMVIFYITCNCLCKCFSFSPLIEINQSNGSFLIPAIGRVTNK